MAQDFYATLGVKKDATQADIKSAYRRLALKWHPDKSKEPDAEKKFKEINYAYEVLSNEDKRKVYDQMGHDMYVKTGGKGGFGGAGAGGPGGGNPFGGAGGGAYQQGPFTWTYTSSGGQGGQGANPFENVDPYDIFEQFFGGGFANAARAARKPTYSITIDFFEAVEGVKKKVKVDGKEREVSIPAGIGDGMTIRFSDFNLLVQIRPDKTFQRDGQDVVVKIDLPFTEAIKGTTLEVPTLDKKKVKVKVKPGTQHGSMLRLRGKGFKVPHRNQHGDQYIVFNVEFPKKLNNKQKKALEDFEKAS